MIHVQHLLILIQGCLANLFILESSLFPQQSWPDIQCFTVQPVLEIPPRLKNKPVPDQIIKSVSRMLNSTWAFSDNLAIPFWLQTPVSFVLRRQLLQIQLRAAFPLFQTCKERTCGPQQRVCSEHFRDPFFFLLILVRKHITVVITVGSCFASDHFSRFLMSKMDLNPIKELLYCRIKYQTTLKAEVVKRSKSRREMRCCFKHDKEG